MKPSARNILLLLLTLSIFLFVGIGGLPVETVGDETDELLLFTSIASPVKPSENMICPSAISPKQSWVVEINELLFNGKVKKGDRLIFDLPGEAAHSFSVDRVNIDINGTLTIRGRHADDDFGYLLLTWDGDRVLSSIRNYDEQKEYIINYDSSRDRHLLHEVASRDADVIENGPPLIPPGEIGLQYVNPTLPEIDEEVTIDVMIVYTPAARDYAVEQEADINTFIAQAMERGQLALDNSDVGVQLRLVHSAEVDYTEYNGGMGTSTDLGRLQKKNDGYMDQVHAWRDQYGADLVNLFTECGDYGGLGYMLSNEIPKPDYGFSITRVQQAWFTWTTLHEFGHNWGLGHSKEQTAGPGPGIYSYAAGWRWTGEDLELYASIMAYGEGVYTIVPHISNPDIWYQGTRTGDSKDGDNARTTRQTKTIVAGYRPTAKLITSFSFPEQTGPAVIDTKNRTVWIEVASGTDLTGLKAVFTLSGGATARVNGEEQISGETENDFSEPLTYTVEAEDGSTAEWVVTVTVNVPVESLHLDVDRIVIREGEDAKLTATVEPADASDRRVTWSSDEEDIAAVDVTGKVTALSAGTATINACTVDGHFTAECEILVIGQDWDLEETTEVQRIIPDADGMAIASFPTLQAFLRIETTDHAGVVAMTSFDSGRLVLPPALLSIGSYIVPNISDNIDYTGMELEMGYRPQDFPGEVVENELRLFTDNDRSGVWQEVPDQHIDTGNKTITAHLGELTPLAIFDKVLFGDVDLDGEVDVADAIQILRVIVGLAEFSPAGMKRAVVSTGEGSFPNVADAILVLQKIVGLIGDFPVELN